jgi:hypothetical protein
VWNNESKIQKFQQRIKELKRDGTTSKDPAGSISCTCLDHLPWPRKALNHTTINFFRKILLSVSAGRIIPKKR